MRIAKKVKKSERVKKRRIKMKRIHLLRAARTKEVDPASDEERFEALMSLEKLRQTWRAIRKEARSHRVRDCVDWLDWAVSIEATLPAIRDSLLTGSFVPSPPVRYQLAKSKGAFRVVTAPTIRDALVYRHICDEALRLALPHKVAGAYFSRRHSATPVGKTLSVESDPYLEHFEIWMRYQEYRTRTLLNAPYCALVTTDITNYFDSISHELLQEYLSPLGLPRKAVGLLGRLLEAFKPPAGHSPNPRIGIPVDEYDCSRELAHIFLFEHDRRIVKDVGEHNYVRWMDDQNIGAESETEARRIVNRLTASLASQRLTLNAGKTLFLSPTEVVTHFQLDANERITSWEKRHSPVAPNKRLRAKRAFEELWSELRESPATGQGHWEKILKRAYGKAAEVGSAALDGLMYDDLVHYPDLCDRIFLCLAVRGKGAELLRAFSRFCREGESLFEATEAVFFETCLLLSADPLLEKTLLRFASRFARGEVEGQSPGAYGKASAVLCAYWFNLPARELAQSFTGNEATTLPAPVARAWLATVTARDARCLHTVQAKLVGHPSDDVSKLSSFLTDLLSGAVDSVGHYKRQQKKWPLQMKYYDVRAWLQLELLSWAKSKRLRATAKADLEYFSKVAVSRQEKRVLARTAARLGKRIP